MQTHLATVSPFTKLLPLSFQDTGLSFNIPEDYQAHSSFNTLDKPAKRSSSPDAPQNTTSFGVTNTSTDNLTARVDSPPRYQDMPGSDGTVL